MLGTVDQFLLGSESLNHCACESILFFLVYSSLYYLIIINFILINEMY